MNRNDKGWKHISTGTLQKMSKSTYQKDTKNIDNWRYLKGNEWVKFYGKGDEVVIATRGSQSSEDWTDANRRIPFNQLESSNVYKRDEDFIKQFKSEYPEYKKYYGVGHSLSGAINDIYLRKGIIDEAVSFNPAVETQHFNKDVPQHRRIYMSDDPLYFLMGRRLSQIPEVKPSKMSWKNWFASHTPLKRLAEASHILDAHDIDRFEQPESIQQIHGGNIRLPKQSHKLPENLLLNL